MNNKLNIPVYIITLNNRSKFDFKKYFNNVHYFKAVDARNKSPKEYYNQGIISQRVLLDFERGRKDHFAFSGIGGIGLFLSYRKLINELQNIKENVLICEEDCNIKNLDNFKRKVNLLNNENFDCVIFGPIETKKISKFKNLVEEQFKESNNIIQPYSLPEILKKDFKKWEDSYIGNHSIIWSPTGIKKIKYYLDKIIEQQLDFLIAFLSENKKINLLIEKDKTTSQILHKSTLQNDNECKLCDYDATKKKYNKSIYTHIKYYFYIFILVIIILVLCYYTYLYNR